MNKLQRKTMQHVVNVLSSLTDMGLMESIQTPVLKTRLEEAESTITTIGEEEREKFDNMPEGLQSSPTGEAIETAADTLENILWPDPDDHDLTTEDGRLTLIDEIQAVIDEIDGV